MNTANMVRLTELEDLHNMGGLRYEELEELRELTANEKEWLLESDIREEFKEARNIVNKNRLAELKQLGL